MTCCGTLPLTNPYPRLIIQRASQRLPVVTPDTLPVAVIQLAEERGGEMRKINNTSNKGEREQRTGQKIGVQRCCSSC